MSTEQTGPVAEIVAAAAQMRVVRGAPDDLEVAALVAGLVAVASSGAVVPTTSRRPGSGCAARALPRRCPRVGTPGAGACAERRLLADASRSQLKSFDPCSMKISTKRNATQAIPA